MTRKETHSAVSNFFVTEKKKLINFINQRVYTYEIDAEDVIQDVALNIFSRIDFDTPIRNIGAVIYRSIRNKIIDIRRRKNNNVLYESFTNDNDESVLIKTIPEESISYEEIEQKKQEEEKLYKALDKLNPNQHEIIIATEFEGNTFEQLSKQWKVPIGTLLARKHRAMAKLQELYFDNN